MDEDIRSAVHVARDEIRGIAQKGDEAPIGRDVDSYDGGVVALRAVRRNAHPFGRPSQAVVNEDIRNAVRVARDEIRSIAQKGDEAPIGYRRVKGVRQAAGGLRAV